MGEVALILDMREVSSREDRDYMERHLKEKGIKCQVRQLSLGDMVWITRIRKNNKKEEEEEVMMNQVIERKTVEDMKSSLMSGHVKEQLKRAALW